jgi:hypothetical protein
MKGNVYEQYIYEQYIYIYVTYTHASCIHTYDTGWWFGTFFIFPYIGNVIIPTDELIFFRGVGIPPTSDI